MDTKIEMIKNRAWAANDSLNTDDIRAQLFPDEKKLLYWLSSSYYRGQGLIVDAGAFLGGSALCFALGLEDNDSISDKARSGCIHSFDLFRYGEFVPDKWIPKGELKVGDSFLHKYHNALRGKDHLTTIHPGDIARATWNCPIEILFIDICKNKDSNDSVSKLFFPHIIPGETLLIQQDYFHTSRNIWIYATMELIKSKLEMLTHTGRNSVVYLIKEEISAADIENCLIAELDDEKLISTAHKAAMRWPEGPYRDIILKSISLYEQDL